MLRSFSHWWEANTKDTSLAEKTFMIPVVLQVTILEALPLLTSVWTLRRGVFWFRPTHVTLLELTNIRARAANK